MIINTNDSPDHAGGNANIRTSSLFHPIGNQAIIAHEKVQSRMLEMKNAVPTTTYSSEKYTVPVFQ